MEEIFMLESAPSLSGERPDKLNFRQASSKLLIQEPPLQVLPSLAVIIGLNESIILQQIHYWISNPLNKNIVNGRKWVYNTYEEWKKQFPFWSKNTIVRAMDSLEAKKLIISGAFNKMASDRTKWYTIDYEAMDCLHLGAFTQNGYMQLPKMDNPIYPKWVNGTTQNGYMELPKMGKCNTRDYLPETISEINSENISSFDTKSQKSKKTEKRTGKRFDKEFEEFWKINPKKVDKPESIEIFNRLLSEDYNNFQKIMDGRRAQNVVIEFEGTPQKYIKGPASWLRKQRFNDEVQTEKQLNEEHQRATRKISNKPMGLSALDQYHNLNAELREKARQHLIRNMQDEARERGEEWEWDGTDSSLGIPDF
jgi:hypothetical protein